MVYSRHIYFVVCDTLPKCIIMKHVSNKLFPTSRLKWVTKIYFIVKVSYWIVTPRLFVERGLSITGGVANTVVRKVATFLTKELIETTLTLFSIYVWNYCIHSSSNKRYLEYEITIFKEINITSRSQPWSGIRPSTNVRCGTPVNVYACLANAAFHLIDLLAAKRPTLISPL